MSKPRNDLTAEQVREMFDYDGENGILIRKTFKNGKHKPCGHTPNRYGYGQVDIADKTYQVHRVIWLWYFGSWPAGELDHKDRNRINNRIENLRPVTRSENQHNASTHKDNTSGYPGVSWHKSSNKYQARIMDENKKIYLGLFDTPEEAFLSYQLAKIKYHPSSPIAQQYLRELVYAA